MTDRRAEAIADDLPRFGRPRGSIQAWAAAVASRRMTPLPLVAALAAATALLYLSLLLDDAVFTWLMHEDHPLELVGAVSLLGASVACLVLWSRVKEDVRWRRLRRLSLLVLAAVFFFGFGEEMSWGERIFGFAPPESVQAANRQGEFNVHNLSIFSGELDPDGLFQLFWAAIGVAVPIAAVWRSARGVLQRFLPILPVALAPLFVLNQLLTRGFSELFSRRPDLYHSSTFKPAFSIFEVKESVASLLLCAGFWVLAFRWRREPSAADN